MHIRMLGTGSAFSKKYDNNNALVTYAGHRLLIDCGVTASRALHQMQVELPEISGVLITHLHADHVGGLEEYGLRMKYVYNKKPILFITEELATLLWERTLRGGMEDAVEGLVKLEHFFDVVFLPEDQAIEIFPGFYVELIRTQHIPGKLSYSLFLNHELFYSSDIVFTPELLTDIYEQRNCKYILHDCELSSNPTVHCTLNQLLTLPQELQSKIWLYHYGDTMESFIGKTGAMRFMVQKFDYHFPMS